jgi:hypothetical protein
MMVAKIDQRIVIGDCDPSSLFSSTPTPNILSSVFILIAELMSPAQYVALNSEYQATANYVR